MVISWPDFTGKSNNLLTSSLLDMVWVRKPFDKSWTTYCTPCTSPSWWRHKLIFFIKGLLGFLIYTNVISSMATLKELAQIEIQITLSMHKTSSRINFYPRFLHFHFTDSNMFNTLVIILFLLTLPGLLIFSPNRSMVSSAKRMRMIYFYYISETFRFLVIQYS